MTLSLQQLGPVTIERRGAAVRVLRCEYDGAQDAFDLERDDHHGADTLIRFLAHHGRCGSADTGAAPGGSSFVI